MYFRIQRNSFLISFWCEGSYRSFSPIDMYPEYIFILENIQREIETICTKKHYKYGNYYNFTNPLDVRLKGFSQVEGGTSQSNWLPTYYILSFFFLSDPSPIIVYPCHSLTDWLTDSLLLVNLIDVTLVCEDANSKLVTVVANVVPNVDDEDRVGNSLLQIW